MLLAKDATQVLWIDNKMGVEKKGRNSGSYESC